MATRRKKKSTILPLDECIKQLEALPSLLALDPKEAGELYVSSIAFLHHLSIDQDAIMRKQNEQNNQDSQASQTLPFPKPNEIPAMTAVVHNQSLFYALVSCLKSTTVCPDATSGNASSLSSSATQSALYTAGARKRNHSIDLSSTVMDTATNKSAKLAPGQSPHTGKRTVNPGNPTKQQQPEMNIRVVSATILYAAFEPLDHWPVPLIEAYAEDSFGARSWVDDPACRPLVQNLELVHAVTGEEDSNQGSTRDSGSMEAEAIMVAEFYKMSNTEREEHSPTTTPTGTEDARRRGSLSSSASGEAMPLAPSLMRKRSASVGSASGSLQSGISQSTSPKSERGSKKPSNGGGQPDSDDDAEVAFATSTAKQSHESDGSSSSSGEDEEVFMEEPSVDGSELVGGEASPSVLASEPPPPSFKLSYPFRPSSIKFARIRQRFFGLNLEYSHHAIALKLNERLDIKSKQNSGLLQCLPSFTAIPSVRNLVTANLEKWLQSPALSGLARVLFSATVKNMRNVDPPLNEDLNTLDNILSMRLKANQLNCHIENLTAVAAGIPTPTVAKHIYRHLLKEILQSMDTPEASLSEHMSMLHAVHDVLPCELRAIGIASSLVDMLVHPSEMTEPPMRSRLASRICHLIRTLHKKFGKSWDSFEVMTAMLTLEGNTLYTWTQEDEENKARVLFQLSILIADPSVLEEKTNSVDGFEYLDEELSSMQKKLQKSRKLLLRWCCNDYARICALSTPGMNGHQKSNNGKANEIIGAGQVNYSSVLDGFDHEEIPNWLKVIRCVLFMETSESVMLRRFVSPDVVSLESDPDWGDSARRIDVCCDYGADLDDDTVRVVLRNATEGENSMPREMALLMLEHLIYCCRKERQPRLLLQDQNLLWKLYELAEYFPPKKSDVLISEGNTIKDNIAEERTIPRLAFAGMWWRVTGIALILCGASPQTFGAIAWEQHPTLAALIKMVTSDRYRFPTVDCDDVAREAQKRTEQSMRDEEARLAEQLFLPPKKPKKKQKQSVAIETSHHGSRASRRQQEKREKVLEKQREKERTEERAEASRRKKLLRAAQKSITLLDPKKGPRKPPRESADLIFSVGELFDLPRVFQKNTNPDFVLATIGSTSRSAIERAYDWLIPIISHLPATISRLPASASCFLLLRAYGTQGEERSELQTLSAPLLQHVHDSLIGKFGEADAVRAFELLFADLASHKPDRRRCSRRVLQNAIGGEEVAKADPPFAGSNHAWISSLTKVEHASSILVDAVNKLTTAATFERGSNLRYLVLALHHLTSFAKDRKIDGEWDFAGILTSLISLRPAVFASALISFANLCSLTINTISEEFKLNIQNSASRNDTGGSVQVQITLCMDAFKENPTDSIKATMPLALLKSSCVILSVWLSGDTNKKDAAAVESLANMLLQSLDFATTSDDGSTAAMHGLASSKLIGTEETIVPVEYWVMLAKSRSDVIAKRAALSAPTVFLPRLLLCSGLPRASLLTMIDRLGKLGEKASDIDKEYNRLLIPSASSEWDIARLGNRREMFRRMFGRISAYFRMFDFSVDDSTDSISLVFYEWLSEACQPDEKPTKPKTKKPKASVPPLFESAWSAGTLLSKLPQYVSEGMDSESAITLNGNSSGMAAFLAFKDADLTKHPERLDDVDAIKLFLKRVFENNNPKVLDDWLSVSFAATNQCMGGKKRRGKIALSPKPKLGDDELAVALLECYVQLDRKVEGLASTIVSWVPRLTSYVGSPQLWALLFAEGQKPSFLWENLLSRCLQTWSHQHIIACRTWLLSGGIHENLDLKKAMRFLIGASTFRGVNTECFVDLPVRSEDSAWARSEDAVRVATHFSLDCLVRSNCEQRLRSRNNLPDCLVLLLLMARIGRKQVHFISQAVMDRLVATQEVSIEHRLLLSLLRLYACFPFSMNLGVAELRSNLTKAVELGADDWLSWRSPFDDTLQDMLRCAFGVSVGEHSSQNLLDTAKKHPLLLLRKLDRITIALYNDAAASNGTEIAKEGVVTGQCLGGPIEAKVNGNTMMVQVKHWGYNYTETSWLLVLDIISAVPHEVLFGCAVPMGLTDLLDLYLALIHIQSQFQTSDRLIILKEKFFVFLERFKSSGSNHWEPWIGSPMNQFPSLGAIRNTLTSCGFMTQEEAMDSVKKAYA